jgi:hypothetical protein
MGAMKHQQIEDAAHDDVIRELMAKLYEMADLFGSFWLDDDANSLDLVRGIFHHARIRHPMTISGTGRLPDPEQAEAAFDAKYPGHKIPLNLATSDPKYLNRERFDIVAETLGMLADALSWKLDDTSDDELNLDVDADFDLGGDLDLDDA